MTFATSAPYLLSAVLFIMSLRGLSTQERARRGNLYGVLGMLIAVATTLGALATSGDSFRLEPIAVLGAALGVGTIIGAILASRVAMTSMPELVAILHSFVGVAAVLVGLASALDAHSRDVDAGVAHEVEIFIGVFVGAITFTGSVIAFLKLRATLSGKPLLLPGRHLLNLLLVSSAIGIAGWGIVVHEHELHALYAVTAIACVLGVHLVIAIGGGDMPVVVSLLNSYSGWAASAAGFMLENDLLIITGALVGSSGAILSYVMCRAMNRSIWNVVFGGFGAESTGKKAKSDGPAQTVQTATATDVALLLERAKRVVIVPGYGLAVAQAQHAVNEITERLQKRGIDARYAIHPVAGRLPGHMNVLLAEAGVPYEIVQEMDEISEDLPKTDVVVVIGANDIVNPSALDDPESPIYGMPVLEVWRATKVVMVKRGMAAGYAGVDNPLCYRENTLMLFGDAKKVATELLAALE